jgi:hypothetical protein
MLSCLTKTYTCVKIHGSLCIKQAFTASPTVKNILSCPICSVKSANLSLSITTGPGLARISCKSLGVCFSKTLNSLYEIHMVRH